MASRTRASAGSKAPVFNPIKPKNDIFEKLFSYHSRAIAIKTARKLFSQQEHERRNAVSQLSALNLSSASSEVLKYTHLQGTSDEAVEALARATPTSKLIRHASHEDYSRNVAMQAIVLQGASAVPVLLEFLTSLFEAKREVARKALTEIINQNPSALNGHPIHTNKKTTLALVALLGTCENPSVKPVLTSIAQTHESEDVRAKAIRSLRAFRDSSTERFVINRMRQDSSSLVQMAAISFLSGLEKPSRESVHLILQSLSNTVSSIQEAALSACGRLRSEEAARAVASAVPSLSTVAGRNLACMSLRDCQEKVSKQSVRRDVATCLVELCGEKRTRVKAVEALSTYADASSHSLVIFLNAIRNPKTCEFAVRGLCAIRSQEATDALLNALSLKQVQENPVLISNIFESISKGSDLDSVRLLFNSQNMRDPASAHLVARAIAGILSNERVARSIDEDEAYHMLEHLRVALRICKNPEEVYKAIGALRTQDAKQFLLGQLRAQEYSSLFGLAFFKDDSIVSELWNATSHLLADDPRLATIVKNYMLSSSSRCAFDYLVELFIMRIVENGELAQWAKTNKGTFTDDVLRNICSTFLCEQDHSNPQFERNREVLSAVQLFGDRTRNILLEQMVSPVRVDPQVFELFKGIVDPVLVAPFCAVVHNAVHPSSSYPRYALDAIEILGAQKNDAAADALFNALCCHRSGPVSVAAAQALEQLPCLPSVSERLAPLVEADLDNWLGHDDGRAAAVLQLLGKGGSSSAFLFLLSLSQNSRVNENLRRQANAAIGLSKSSEIKSKLKHIFTTDSAHSYVAARALAENYSSETDVQELLEPLKDHADPNRRVLAIPVLAAKKDFDSLARLVEDSEHSVMLAAWQALETTTDAAMLRVFLKYVSSSSSELSGRATAKCGSLADEMGGKKILKELFMEGGVYEEPAARLLASKFLSDKSVQSMIAGLKGSSDANLRLISVEALAAQKDVVSLLVLAEDPVHIVQKAAFQVLAPLKDPIALRILIKFLTSPEPELARIANEALEAFGNDAKKHLIELAQDSDAHVRACALGHSILFNDSSNASTFIDALYDISPHLQEIGAKWAEVHGDFTCIAPLVDSLSGPGAVDPGLKARIEHALNAVQGRLI